MCYWLHLMVKDAVNIPFFFMLSCQMKRFNPYGKQKLFLMKECAKMGSNDVAPIYHFI